MANKQTPKDNFSHLQPQAPELEKAVIGALLVEQDAYATICEILKPESFYEHRNQLIYEAVQQLNIHQHPVDVLTVMNELQRTNKLEDAGGPAYLTQLSEMVASSAHIEFHARVIAQKYTARQLITMTSDIQTKAFDASQDIDVLMQEAEANIFKLTQQNVKRDYEQIDPVLNEAYQMLKDAAGKGEGVTGVASGFTDLDKITAGWQKSDLVIIAARPAMGKTAFALTMAKNMAVDMQIPVAFFSLEMSKVQLVNRMMVNVCEISGEKIRTGRLAPFEWEQLDTNIKKLYGAPLYLDDTPSLSVFELHTKARRLKNEHHVEVIMIDYLQLMNASGMKYNSRQEEVSMISRSLKQLAKELQIPILALSQLNRGVETRNGDEKRPNLADLRESGAIEQDADIVTFIHRPEYYHMYADSNGNDLRGKAEIIIAKHRNGSVGDVRLNFKGEFARFENETESTPVPGESTVMASSSAQSAPSDDAFAAPSMNDVPYADSSDPFGSYNPFQ